MGLNRTPSKKDGNQETNEAHASSAMVNNENEQLLNETCPILNCKKIVGDDQDGIQCDVCNLWYHRECIKLSKEEYRIQKRNETSKWFCEKCIGEIQDTKQELKVSKDQNKKLQKELSSLQEEVEKLNTRVKDLTNENSITIDRIQEEFRKKMEEMHRDNMKKVGSNETPEHALKEQHIRIEQGKIILTLEKENSMLKDEVNDLEKKLGELKEEGEIITEQRNVWKEYLESLERDKKVIEEDRFKFKKQAIELKKENDTIENQLKHIKNELKEMKEKYENIRDPREVRGNSNYGRPNKSYARVATNHSTEQRNVKNK